MTELISHSSGTWKSEIKELEGLVSSEASLQLADTLLLPLLVAIPLCMNPRFLSACPLSSFYKDTNHVGLGPTLMASFLLNHLFIGPISKCSHILRC